MQLEAKCASSFCSFLSVFGSAGSSTQVVTSPLPFPTHLASLFCAMRATLRASLFMESMHALDWLNTFTSIDLLSKPLLSGNRISSSGPGVKENTTRTSVALSPGFTPEANRSMAVGAMIGLPVTVVSGTVPALTDTSTE